MPTITTKDGVEIFYKDWGSGQPIVFSHGWPLSADDWDAQMLSFLNHGYRVIAHTAVAMAAPPKLATATIWITTPMTSPLLPLILT
jgi:pimeloyl-ACP methyl ester carboxylesterase